MNQPSKPNPLSLSEARMSFYQPCLLILPIYLLHSSSPSIPTPWGLRREQLWFWKCILEEKIKGSSLNAMHPFDKKVRYNNHLPQTEKKSSSQQLPPLLNNPTSPTLLHHTHLPAIQTKRSPLSQLPSSQHTNYLNPKTKKIMKKATTLLLTLTLTTLITASTNTLFSPVTDQRSLALGLTPNPRLKRQYESCQATYGGGSVTCGEEGVSRYCYDPTKGEVSLNGEEAEINGCWRDEIVMLSIG